MDIQGKSSLRNKSKVARKSAKAKRAHDKAKSSGQTPVGTRRVQTPNPRFLNSGVTTVPVYKKEQKSLDKVSKLQGKSAAASSKDAKRGIKKSVRQAKRVGRMSTPGRSKNPLGKRKKVGMHSSCKKGARC
tara:strand:- start:48 stop:440 length:393 start_codon:yes stop_codon:yes gene_type:complete